MPCNLDCAGTNGDAMQLPYPPKFEDSTTTSSCGEILPPIFPPTPTSANSENQDTLHYFESRLFHDFNDSMVFPACSSLPSPSYNMVGSIYDGYFKQEGTYQYSSCMTPCLPLDGINPTNFDPTPSPLTPQSSFCSSNSPLSHVSIHSPDSAAQTPDLEVARPLSQGSMYNPDNVHVGDMVHAHLMSGSTCTSPLQHVPTSNSLDITASLDVAAASADTLCSPDFIQSSYDMIILSVGWWTSLQ